MVNVRAVETFSTPEFHKQYIYLYAFFWVITRRLEFTCRRFGTLCLFHLHRQVDVSRINQKKAYNIQNTAKA